MKEEIYKITFNRYSTTFHKDTNPVNDWDLDWFPKGGIFSADRTSDLEEDYQNNFANPFCRVTKFGCMLLIERNGMKISLKFYEFLKSRKAGVKWFSVHKDMKFFTVDTEKGDIYSGEIRNYHLKKNFKKTFNKNLFKYNPFRNFIASVVSTVRNNEEYVKDVMATFKMYLQLVDGDQDSDDLSEKRILKYYLEKKKIKYPNNFSLFYFNIQGKQPTLKNLRKCNFKLVDAVMKQYDLKGDTIKKVLHSLPEESAFELLNLKIILEIFPESWVLQDPELVSKILTSYGQFTIYIKEQLFLAKKVMSPKEFRNTFSCYKDYYLTGNFSLNSLGDHLEFYNYLVRVGEKIKWKSNSWSVFKTEHLDWADKYEHYKRGYYTRIYPQSLDDNFKIPFIQGDDVYYPVILKTSEEYNEESQTQSNCVKGYIGRPSSLIVSIRKNSTISKERATVEYQVFKEGENIKFNRPQSLGTFNSRLDETWTPILKEADDRMRTWINSSDKFVTVKIEKQLKNYDRKLFSDSDWSENGFLFWTYFLITKESINTPQYFNAIDLI